MKKIIDYLEKLDLSDIEANLYVTLLKTGAISVRDLAQAVGIKRTTAYLYIDQLIDKGLVTKIVKGAQKLISVTDAENLQELVSQKIHNAKKIEDQFPSILHTIQGSYTLDHANKDAEIKYYKGKIGVRKIYEEALRAKELRSYFNIELIKKILPDNGILFVNGLKQNNTIRIYELLQDTNISREKLKESRTFNLNYDRYSYKFLPEGVNLSAADVLIYDGHVSIVNASTDQVSGIILQDSAYYNNSKELFDLVWKVLPDIERSI